MQMEVGNAIMDHTHSEGSRTALTNKYQSDFQNT